MSKLIIVIRVALTAFLIVGVYRETGIFTTIAVTFSAISIEIITKCIKQIRQILQALKGD